MGMAAMSKDIGLTHIALQVRSIEESIRFYSTYARMVVAHRRLDSMTGSSVVWLTDRTRPFAIVLMQSDVVGTVLRPFAHIGVGCASKGEVIRLAALAKSEGTLVDGPNDGGYPVGYWAFLRDPDGHTLEISFGQEIGMAVETLGTDSSANEDGTGRVVSQ